MNNAELEKQLQKTWKELIQANIHHDETLADSRLKEIILLEIQQKNRRH
ncbi:MAG: hypothetical protein PF440_10810 [Thiomicrorhabdus sp.]|jgi:hypothetical protein|nr:hypothetical protein [Thiomicrorhabdus sp.]